MVRFSAGYPPSRVDLPCIRELLWALSSCGTFGWPFRKYRSYGNSGCQLLHFMRTPTKKAGNCSTKLGVSPVSARSDQFPWISSQLRMSTQNLRKFSLCGSLRGRTSVVQSIPCNCFDFHQPEPFPSQSFYLGMWDGKPVEIVYPPATVTLHAQQ